MLRFQKLIFVCVLVVSSWKCSSGVLSKFKLGAYETGFQLPPPVRFDLLLGFLDDGIRARTALFDANLNLNTLHRLRDTSDSFRKTCVWAFEKRLATEKMNYNSPNKGQLGKLAFEAVDKTCKNIIMAMQMMVLNDEPVSEQLHSILYKGDILDFIIFFQDPNIPRKDWIIEVNRLQNFYPGISETDAKVRIALEKYNMGKIREEYPPPITDSEMDWDVLNAVIDRAIEFEDW